MSDKSKGIIAGALSVVEFIGGIMGVGGCKTDDIQCQAEQLHQAEQLAREERKLDEDSRKR